ncbi:sensor histidine kinase [Bacillus testis]|uniref:sensor histidine kinase n=1 Tax=Bacillus testis TaxID=1622072 RepID=UPI00067F21C7|nr:sensor histidine kinase [Bacillus testis]
MIKRHLAFQKNNGITPYIWTILCILPFYFIFQSSSTIHIIVGIILTVVFLVSFRIALAAKGWIVYVWAFFLIGISVTATSLFSYMYFAFFLAYYVGNIKERVAFIILYFMLLLSTAASINISIFQHDEVFLHQLPFVIIVAISVILLPFNIHNRKERGQLEEKLEDANKRIAELIKIEERERIARDLHDTLGQKLSLIGLKSDLARRLIATNPVQASNELKDVQQTARTALNEVRKIVASMRGIRLKDELVRIKQLLDAAEISCEDISGFKHVKLSPLKENILSMCLKEAINNVVKHSGASTCIVKLEQDWKDTVLTVSDNGIYKRAAESKLRGHGMLGMKERLEFVNGSLQLLTDNGTTLIITIPTDAKMAEKEDAQ